MTIWQERDYVAVFDRGNPGHSDLLSPADRPLIGNIHRKKDVEPL